MGDNADIKDSIQELRETGKFSDKEIKRTEYILTRMDYLMRESESGNITDKEAVLSALKIFINPLHIKTTIKVINIMDMED